MHAVTVRERLAPVTGAAFFECSDPMLDQIWRVGRRTVSLCSFDAYLDCPTREQRAWTGDAVVHQMVDLTTNADWRLARWYPHVAASPRADGMLPMAAAGDAEAGEIAIIPDWALHWVHAVWNLYRYVGDRDEIAALMPVVEGVLRWFEPYVDDDGLLRDVISWVIIDWASVETDGVSAALCGLWARGLLDFAEMADWLGDTGRAAWARTRHASLTQGFAALWDPARGRYRDTLTTVAASQHGQAAAIVGGLAPRANGTGWSRCSPRKPTSCTRRSAFPIAKRSRTATSPSAAPICAGAIRARGGTSSARSSGRSPSSVTWCTTRSRPRAGPI